MAERESTESVYCLGCGNDLKEIPTERRNLGSDSLATPEPRERVLSSWTSLLNQELQCQGTTIESYIKDPVIQGECVVSAFMIMKSMQSSTKNFYIQGNGENYNTSTTTTFS